MQRSKVEQGSLAKSNWCCCAADLPDALPSETDCCSHDSDRHAREKRIRNRIVAVFDRATDLASRELEFLDVGALGLFIHVKTILPHVSNRLDASGCAEAPGEAKISVEITAALTVLMPLPSQ